MKIYSSKKTYWVRKTNSHLLCLFVLRTLLFIKILKFCIDKISIYRYTINCIISSNTVNTVSGRGGC